MKQQLLELNDVKYYFDAKGAFVIENYNQSKSFSNFFPGIAGIRGIPMWVFYVNRAQCITSFGIEDKDKAIMEFQPANKSYRQTALKGFRTFVKVQSAGQSDYWEPFQNYLPGTNFKKKTRLIMTAHDLTIEETNYDLGLVARVNYFTLPEEPYAALVRRLFIRNIGDAAREIELIDGLPMIVPFGFKDWLIKNISRTVEAWIKVGNLSNSAPYFQLNVEVSDKPEVNHIKEGNFYFGFEADAGHSAILKPIVEAACVFGQSIDFIAPANFLNGEFKIPLKQQTSNRTPSAMGYGKFSLDAHQEKQIVSLLGFAHSEEQLNQMVHQVTAPTFVEEKARRNKEIIDEIKNFALTVTSSEEFNGYAANTFLDNILRGGLPITIATDKEPVTFNVFSRKHGDLERDYNYFVVSPTFYSQGNGNYRDVNQNRRNDVWFNTRVGDSHLINFLNLIQADGYNPLIVKGTTFSVHDAGKLDGVLTVCLKAEDQPALKKFLEADFLPGALMKHIYLQKISLKVSDQEFLSRILSVCRKQESAEHGEGYWSDHWTYNLDLIESYLAVFPEDLKNLLLEKKVFNFYLDTHYVLPRAQRYILTDKGVRQYHSVAKNEAIEKRFEKDRKLRIKQGEGTVYTTSLIVKLLCLLANKAASLDPSGVGVEMEADKPNWYDALNGLPGLLGSSISETLELGRLSRFVLESLKQLSLDDNVKIPVFEELVTFISGLTHILSLETDPLLFWNKANDIKEHYRQRVRMGIDGVETPVSIAEIKQFLSHVIQKTTQALDLARDRQGNLATYFYHEVIEHTALVDQGQQEAHHFVRPLKFKRHALPPFLEGYVHAIREENDPAKCRAFYQQVRASGLFDQKLKMYKVNADLSGEPEDIGRTRIFPRGWLENESIWLHMEYKFILELLRKGLYEEFYENFRHVLIPFLNPAQYGRSVLENSSFIVSSAHEDETSHGQGFVARLSGSTAEFLHIWLFMNVGRKPFVLNSQKELVLHLNPSLPAWLFTNKKTRVHYLDLSLKWQVVELPENVYAFNLFGSILVVYHNPRRLDTFGKNRAAIKKIQLSYTGGQKNPVVLSSEFIPAPYAREIRDQKIERMDVYFE